MNCYTYITLCVAFSSSGFSIDLKILPNVPELTLTSESNYIIKCQGNGPVKWNISESNPVLSANKSSSIEMLQTYSEANARNISMLLLNRVSYSNIGYYYCVPSSGDRQLYSINSEKIYLFVRSPTHLLLNAPSNLTRDEFGDLIIPCRPTSPDINITLKKNDVTITSGFKYDAKLGYTFILPSDEMSGSYLCEASRNSVSQSQIFYVSIKPNFTKSGYPTIINDSVAIKNHNKSLFCSAEVDPNIFTLKWTVVPNKNKLQKKQIQIITHNNYSSVIDNVKINLELKIQNITLEDEGEYVCEVLARSGHMKRDTYTLKIFNITNNYTVMNLTVHDGIYNKIHKAGYNITTWTVDISHNLMKFPKWKYPNGEVIKYDSSSRIYVEEGNRRSTLVIRNLQLSDSGFYEMSVFNQNNSKKIAVSLLVESKPEFRNNLSNISVFYEVGKTHNVDCFVDGYPLPNVSWAFKKCLDYPNCTDTYTFDNLTKKMHKEHVSNVTKLTSTLNITANYTGILLCSASNDFGFSSYELTFLMTDLFNNFNGLAINGPKFILIGDNITINCGVAKNYYNKNIRWFFRPINGTKYEIKHSENHTIISNSTKYSFYSYMTMNNINNSSNGEYFCVVSNVKNLSKVHLPYPLMVRRPYIPIIYKSSSATFNVNLTKFVTLQCKMRGLPQPTMSWFHDNLKLQIKNNNNKFHFEDNNQTLHIRNISIGNLGPYTCSAQNKMGTSNKTISLMLLTKDLTVKSEEKLDKSNAYYNTTIFYCAFLIGLGIILCIIISMVNCLKKKRKLDKFRKGALHCFNPELGIEEQANLLPYDEKFEFSKNKIKLGVQLGSGAFGIVYKAEADGIIEKNITSTIAVKMVKPGSDPSHVNALVSELKIMIHLGRHVNIVNLLGAYTVNINEKLMVFVEYCHFGNIHDYMIKNRSGFVNQVTPDGRLNFNYKIKSFAHNPCYEYDPDKKIPCNENGTDKKYASSNVDGNGKETDDDGYLLSIDHDEPESRYQYCGYYEKEKVKELCTHDLLSWSFQIARGMEYLASKKILHGDLATRNILLAYDNIVKICDFGFAKSMYNSENYKKKSEGLLPIKWMAIESLQDQIYSTKSDVWSFGIVLWELFSLGTVPYPDISARNLLMKLKEGYRMKQPLYANSNIYNIMLSCWKEEPTTRPSFTDLIESIGNFFQGDEKANIISLNDVYEKNNTIESNSKSVLNALSKPTYINSQTTITKNPSLNTIEYSKVTGLKIKEL